MKSKVINSAKWQVISVFSLAVIQLCQLVFTANFFGVELFGIIALSQMIIGLAQVFSEGGMSSFYIYRQRLKPSQISTLYWTNILIGSVLSLFLFSIVLLLENEINKYLYEILLVASFNFFFASWGIQRQAHYIKIFKHNILAIIDILSKIISLITLLILSLNDYGVISFPISILVGVVLKSSLLLIISDTTECFKLEFEKKIFYEMIHFSKYQVAGQVLNQLKSNADSFFVNLYLSTSALGLYSLAKQIVSYSNRFVAPVFNKVTLPLFSEIQNDKNKINLVLIKLLRISAAINFSVYFLLIFYSEYILDYVFTESYKDAAIIIAILSVVWALRSVSGSLFSPVLLALGKPKVEYKWNVYTSLLAVLVVVIFSKDGLLTLSLSILALQVSFCLFVPKIMISEISDVSFKSYFSILALKSFSSIAVIFPLYIVSEYFENIVIKLLLIMMTLIILLFYHYKSEVNASKKLK